VKGLLERLRDRGWQMTPQRRVVAEVLAGEHVHLTADEIHERAAARLPEISRATVYKTLGELVQLAEVREILIDGRARRYDPNLDATHHHLVCESCGAIRDVYPQGKENLRLTKAQRFGFKLTGHDIVFRGLCPDCATGKASPRARRAGGSDSGPAKAPAGRKRPAAVK
jgi:Fur family transcriptional regulator, stress-responsive regulator